MVFQVKIKMTDNTRIYISKAGSTSAYVDLLQMLTGAGLILFMYSHMVLVASVNLGPETMNAIARFFENTYMAQVGGPIIGIIFLFHFVLAARKIPFKTNEVSIFWKHSMLLRHIDTWLWMIQVFTAMIILIMGSIHIWTILTDLPISAAKSASHIRSGYWLVFDLILLLMVEVHTGIGFYRIAVKWGFIKRRGRIPFAVIVVILTAIFISIGLITIVNFLRLPL